MTTDPTRHTRMTGPLPLSADGLLHGAQTALQHYAKNDIPLPNGHRLQLAVKLLKDIVAGRIRVENHTSQAELNRIRDAYVTSLEHSIIARSLIPRAGDAGSAIRRKIIDSLSGAPLENQDRNPIGRNTQFELFVAAILTMGNAIVHLGEPDLLLMYGSQLVGIAAKRVQSEKKIVDRAVDAANQIQRLGIFGFVAINLDSISREIATDVSNTATELQEKYPVLCDIDSALSKRPQVLGRLVFIRKAMWDETTDQRTLRLGIRFFGWAYTDRPHPHGDPHSFFECLVSTVGRRFEKL